jgi:hypothetical protein
MSSVDGDTVMSMARSLCAPSRNRVSRGRGLGAKPIETTACWMRSLERALDRNAFGPVVERARHRLAHDRSLAVDASFAIDPALAMWDRAAGPARDRLGRGDLQETRKRHRALATQGPDALQSALVTGQTNPEYSTERDRNAMRAARGGYREGGGVDPAWISPRPRNEGPREPETERGRKAARAAAELHRRLSTRNTDTFWPVLATSLSDLGNS